MRKLNAFCGSGSVLFWLTSCILLMSCAPSGRSFVKTKVFSLSPEEYLGQKVYLSGKVSSVGLGGGAFFVFEDDTGKVLVTSERIPDRMDCTEGSQVIIRGNLTRLSSSDQTFFSLESPVQCL